VGEGGLKTSGNASEKEFVNLDLLFIYIYPGGKARQAQIHLPPSLGKY
jgi:hypothetical protein